VPSAGRHITFIPSKRAWDILLQPDFDALRPELCISIGADVMSWAKAFSHDW